MDQRTYWAILDDGAPLPWTVAPTRREVIESFVAAMDHIPWRALRRRGYSASRVVVEPV